MISLSKRQKNLWNWRLMKLEILIFRILEDKKCIFWQNEAFLVKTKLRFGIRGSKYIIWVRGLSSDFGSLEFSYFWKLAVTFMWKIEHCEVEAWPDGRLFWRPPTLTAGNFKALYPTDPIFIVLKDLNPFQKYKKN